MFLSSLIFMSVIGLLVEIRQLSMNPLWLTVRECDPFPLHLTMLFLKPSSFPSIDSYTLVINCLRFCQFQLCVKLPFRFVAILIWRFACRLVSQQLLDSLIEHSLPVSAFSFLTVILFIRSPKKLLFLVSHHLQFSTAVAFALHGPTNIGRETHLTVWTVYMLLNFQ